MITRIEIDGFKTFQNFGVDLNPFQVIIGANGSGKSNLFEAILLLGKLSSTYMSAAFEGQRGEWSEQFSIGPMNVASNYIRFNVELFLDEKVRDSWGKSTRLVHRRLRYDLEIEHRPHRAGWEQLYVLREALYPINPRKDIWLQNRGVELNLSAASMDVKYIDAYENSVSNETTLLLFPDKAGKNSKKRETSASAVTRTMLSRIDTVEFPHVLAVRQEMQQWALVESHPETLRSPSLLSNRGEVEHEIPVTLARMKDDNPDAFRSVSRDLSNLMPEILGIEVEKDNHDELQIYVRLTDNRRLPARLLSDGIVRSLMLLTVKNDPKSSGTILMEEPENSIHPGQLKRLVSLLREMATKVDDLEVVQAPLRQILVNTHSPEIVNELNLENGELLFAELVSRIAPNGLSQRATQMTPVSTASDDKHKSYVLARVIEYLNSVSVGESQSKIREALRL